MYYIRGGSDIVLDLISKVDTEKKVKYIFFDTGIELEATKKHLKYLEDRYEIEIERRKAIKTIPIACKEFGVPFLNKNVSRNIRRLQEIGFDWKNYSRDELIAKYPKRLTEINWWTNEYEKRWQLQNPGKKSKGTFYDIKRNKWLKEFLIENPPDFKISEQCCKYSKKDVAKEFIKEAKCDLNIYGIRRAEGGIRSVTKTCYSPKGSAVATYRPIFWFRNKEKEDYEKCFDIIHSDCYTKYGMKRTGCTGCPFAIDFEKNLKIIEKYEPKMYKAALYVFSKSYEYTRKYKEFQKMMNEKEK